jgi:hypothetical protein
MTAFYGRRSFIVMSIWKRHWTLFWARWTHSTPLYSSFKICSNNILPYVSWCPKRSLPFRLFDENFVLVFNLSHAWYLCLLHLHFWFYHYNVICWTLKLMELLIEKFFAPILNLWKQIWRKEMLLRSYYVRTKPLVKAKAKVSTCLTKHHAMKTYGKSRYLSRHS